MKKEQLKAIFVSVLLAICAKGLYFGFDFASASLVLILGSLVFGYDFINTHKEIDQLKAEIKSLKDNQKTLNEDIQQMKSARNVQKINNLMAPNKF